MAGFVYRMENILKIKRQMENQAKMEFAKKQELLMQEQTRLLELQEKKQTCLEQGRALRRQTLHAMDLKQNADACTAVDELILAQLKKLERAGKELDEARRKLELLRQERKAQERLREKAFDEFLKEEKEKEAKEIDELVSFTYGERIKEEADG